MDSAITGKSKTIIRPSICADENPIAVFAAAQAWAGGDLGIIIINEEVMPQAGHVHVALNSESDLIAVNICAGLIGGGNVPER